MSIYGLLHYRRFTRPVGHPAQFAPGGYRPQRAPLRIPLIVYPTPSRNGDGSWTFTWAGSAPFEIWLDGRQLEANYASTTYVYSGGVYEDTPPPLEIIEVGLVADNSLHPPYAQLQWRGLQAALSYEVQQFIAAAWTGVATVAETGAGYYQWESDPLNDDETHQFRVIALDNDREGSPIAFDIYMMRNPAPPEVAVTIDTAGDVVVSSA